MFKNYEKCSKIQKSSWISKKFIALEKNSRTMRKNFINLEKNVHGFEKKSPILKKVPLISKISSQI